MNRQLSLDEPLPATPKTREAAVLGAFNGNPALVVSMRAARHTCPWSGCKAPPGEACSVRRGRRLLRFPHPSRVALTVACGEHSAPVGAVCAGVEGGVCPAREALVAPLVALNPALVRSTAGDDAVDSSSWPEELVAEDESGLYAVTGRPVGPPPAQAVSS